jgi:hypothetical protein
MTRRYRGAEYEVEIVNRAGKKPRKAVISVNGKPIRGTLIPPAKKGSRVRIEVELVAKT